MPSDIKLDEDQVTIECRILKTNAENLMLDHPKARGQLKPSNVKGSAFRRALVHLSGDKLVINFDGDYQGGVLIEGKEVTVAGDMRVKGQNLIAQQLRIVNPNAKEGTGSPGGRALVQDESDTLVVNQAGFYQGGVRVEGAALSVSKDIILGGKLMTNDPAGGPFPVADIVNLVFELRSEVKALQKQVANLEAKLKGK